MSSSKKRSRATPAIASFDPSLRSALVHLPVALYGPLMERGVPPQTIVVEVARAEASGSHDQYDGHETSRRVDKIYVGWSGMSAAPLSASEAASSVASSSAEGASAASVVCLSPTLASTFSPPLVAGAHVRLTLLRAPPLPTASRIDVVPLSPDDWEVLSLNADEIENSMLGQVRAARTGMTIAVHVGRQGRTVCRFRVEACTPATQDYGDSADVEGLARAVRLDTDTEIVIAPRMRAQDSSVGNGAAAEAQDVDIGDKDQQSFSRAGKTGGRVRASMLHTPAAAQDYLRHSPFRVLPTTFKSLQNAGRSQLLVRRDDAEVLALAFSGQVQHEGRCAITKTPCPSAPDVYASALSSSDTRSAQSGKDSSKQEGEPTRAESSNAAGASNSDVPIRATTSASFAPIEDALEASIASRHIWVPADIRQKLNLRDYDLVRFSSPAPSGMGISRPSSPQLVPKSLEDDKSKSASESALPGFSSILQSCLGLVENTFSDRAWAALQFSMDLGLGGASSRAAALRPQTTSAMLITGASGSGKTMLVNALSAQVSPQLIASMTIDCTSLADERLSALRSTFDQWLAVAAWHSPTLLVLENLDRIAPADQEHVDSPRSVQVAESLMYRIRDATAKFPIFVIATAQSTTSLNKVCTSAYRVFGEIVEIKAPTKDARKEILAHLVDLRSGLPPSALDYAKLAGKTEGYLPVDLRDLVERAVHQSAVRAAESMYRSPAVRKSNGHTNDHLSVDGDADGLTSSDRRDIRMDDFDEAQRGFTPLSLRNIQLTRSTTKWSDIGGLQETRRVLRETLEWPTRYAKIFAQCPLRLRSGLLLYGYPGCGKTLLAGAVAAECGLNFISVKGPEILQKYIGASEKSVRDLFDRAQAAKPCVLFFDEFDSIAPKRGHDSTGVTDRVVNQLLTQMDGAEGLSGVYVLAATSRPDLIDSALLRPGRLDKSLLCDLPSKADRLDILQVVCRSNKIALADDVDLNMWAQRTEGFSGADLQALVYNANLEAIHESMSAETVDGADKEADAGQASDAVQFIHLKKIGTASTAAQSGAERQAMQRRMELMMQNVEEEAEAARKAQRMLRYGFSDDAASTQPNGDATHKAASSFVVTEAQLQKCLKTTRQSVPADEQHRLQRIYQQFIGERSGEFPNGEASREVGARQSLM